MDPLTIGLVWFFTIVAVSEETKDVAQRVDVLEAYIEVLEGVAIKTASSHSSLAARVAIDRNITNLNIEILDRDMDTHDHKPDHVHPNKP
jgi:hypothetical protein